MELEKFRKPTEQEVRWSKDNMMCIVSYEPLPEAIQVEIEKILETAEAV